MQLCGVRASGQQQGSSGKNTQKKQKKLWTEGLKASGKNAQTNRNSFEFVGLKGQWQKHPEKQSFEFVGLTDSDKNTQKNRNSFESAGLRASGKNVLKNRNSFEFVGLPRKSFQTKTVQPNTTAYK